MAEKCMIGAGSHKNEKRCGKPAAFAITFKAAPERGDVYVCREHRHALLTEGYCDVRELTDDLQHRQ